MALWAAAALVVVVSLAFAVTAATLPGCTTCHTSTEFRAQTAAHAHKTVDCKDCHVPPGFGSRVTYAYNVLFGMTLGITPIDSGSATAVPNVSCLKCHQKVMNAKTTANGLSILHSKCSKDRACVDCHAETAHGTAVKWNTTVSMNQCLDCHNTARVRADCNMCHSERAEKQRIQTGEWVVTHGPNWRQTHGMGDIKTCAACHDPSYCKRCHGIELPHDDSFFRTHPVIAKANSSDCKVCHRQQFCDSCHGLRMPHPASFTPGHSVLVKKNGPALCLRCHIEDDCTNCHVAHVHPGGAIAPTPTVGPGSTVGAQ